jgi:hypothetical protein
MPQTQRSDFIMAADGIAEIVKAPRADLDYYEDWSAWLAAGEHLVSVEWDVAPGIVKGAEGIIGPVTQVYLSAGTVGEDYLVSATVMTSQARTDTRSFRVLCRLR